MGLFNKEPEFKTTITTRTEKRIDGKQFSMYTSSSGDSVVIRQLTGYLEEYLIINPNSVKELKEILNKWEELP